MSAPQLPLSYREGFHAYSTDSRTASAASWASGSPWAGFVLIVLLHGVVALAFLYWDGSAPEPRPQAPVLVSVVDAAPSEAPTPPAEPLVPEFDAPPQPFVPTPEIVVSEPAPTRPITAAAAPVPPPPSQAPPAPFVAPAAPQAPAAAPPAAGGSVRQLANVGAVCPNSSAVRAALQYPEQALRRNISGEVLVQFLVAADGRMRDLRVVGEAPQVLANAALAATRRFACQGQGRDVLVQVPYTFRLN